MRLEAEAKKKETRQKRKRKNEALKSEMEQEAVRNATKTTTRRRTVWSELLAVSRKNEQVLLMKQRMMA